MRVVEELEPRWKWKRWKRWMRRRWTAAGVDAVGGSL